jgi:hypothetical protein
MKKIVALLMILILIIPTLSFGSSLNPFDNANVEGYMRGWVDGSLEIEEYDGTVHLIPVEEKASFEIDNRPANKKDFKTGMEVSIWVRNGNLYRILSYSAQNPGYIPEGGKVRNGTVKKIDRNQLIIQLPTGKEETYFTTSETTATKNNNVVLLDVLYVGDHVNIYFDEIDTQMISRIEIEGDSVLIKDIYKGRINIVDKYNNYITLSGVEVFRNGNWEKVSGSLRLPFTSDTPVYSAGQLLSYSNIQRYRGRTVYAAVKDYFGTDKIERMVIKSQYETVYNDKIEDINWYEEALELGNKRNLAFNEGTMVIKSGRMVDRFEINLNSDAFITADGRNTEQTANLIYIYNEDLNNSNIGQRRIYSGRLDEVLPGSVNTRELFYLDINEWKSYNFLKEFYFDSETIIFDSENNRQISQEEFYSGEYAVDENSDSYNLYGKRDWNAYFYSDGDRITHILLQKPMDSLLRQRITNGTVESVENDLQVGWSFYLRNGSDWSSQKSKWMARSASTRINGQKSMIIKNGKLISPSELLPGDRLYIIRDDFKAKVVIVK